MQMLFQRSSLRSLQSLIQICAHVQVWQLNGGSLLNDPNVIYTFDFFHPWSYISNETGAVRSHQAKASQNSIAMNF